MMQILIVYNIVKFRLSNAKANTQAILHNSPKIFVFLIENKTILHFMHMCIVHFRQNVKFWNKLIFFLFFLFFKLSKVRCRRKMEKIVVRSNFKYAANDRPKTHYKTYNSRENVQSGNPKWNWNYRRTGFRREFFLGHFGEKITFWNICYAQSVI